ncbi:MAG TPA: penicillin-binding protein 2 [Verrucomicrobiae bacterium]|nr:penicillin-binding protein 2 [Verrucomicrobiae bacterium]
MAKRLQFRRLLFLTALLSGAFALLAFRMVDLQVVRHEEFRVRAQRNTEWRIRIPPLRGDILDARGNLLASSRVVKTVCADPSLVGNRQAEVARAIAPLLELKETEVYEKLLPRTFTNGAGKVVVDQYVVLKNKVPIETWAKVRAAMTNLIFGVDEKKLPSKERTYYNGIRNSVFADPVNDQVRVYPQGSLAAHVLGFVGRDGDTNSINFGQLAGMDGIERTYNDGLSGVPGWRVTETDKRKAEVLALRDQDVPAKDGLNVVLTIDSVVQHILETVLAEGLQKSSPENISGIIIRPRTGEILAMASLPSFDPNQVPRDPELRRNRIITDVDEPGSTFKIVVVSGALNDGTVSLKDVFYCERGKFWFAGRPLHDHDGGYENLTVEGIITKSSNIGSAKIGIKMGEKRLYEYLCEYGFGMPTGIQLPSESRGILHPTRKWSKVSIAQIPMGQGVAVTRLQMVMAMSAIANKGWLMRPMLVSRLVDQEGHVVAEYQPQSVRQVVSETTARQMVQTLKTVVTSDGTATKAALTNYVVAGKTGTAQKAGRGGYLPGKYVSSFIGFFPADNPEVCISIVLDEPKGGYYGGQVAAPIFHKVAESVANYLNIRPDVENTSLQPAKPTNELPAVRTAKTVVAKTRTP